MTSKAEQKIVAVMPAYNEAATIYGVVQAVRGVVDAVVVVDDASQDATAQCAVAAGANIVRHTSNQGYDAALNNGFHQAIQLGATIIVTCDADGQHRVEDVRRIVERLKQGDADIVVGTRDRLVRAGETIFSWYTRPRFGVPDPLCGLKAYRREVYEAVGSFDTLKSIGTQLVAEGWRRKFRIVSIPIHVEARADQSRFYSKRLRANFRILAAMFRIMKLTLWNANR